MWAMRDGEEAKISVLLARTAGATTVPRARGTQNETGHTQQRQNQLVLHMERVLGWSTPIVLSSRLQRTFLFLHTKNRCVFKKTKTIFILKKCISHF